MLQADKKKRLKWKQKFLRHNTIENENNTESRPRIGSNFRSGSIGNIEQTISPSTIRSYGSPSDFESIFTGAHLQFSSGSYTSPPIVEYLPRSHSAGNADLYLASLSLQGITGNSNRGPKIKPYIFTQTHQPTSQRISNVNETKCFICEELLQTKLQYERLVELKCGDFIHGECFEISITCGIEKLTKTENFTKLTSKNMEQVFPFCKGTNCKHIERKIEPVDESLIDNLFTSALINQKEKLSHTRNSNLAILNSTLKTQGVQQSNGRNSISTPRSSISSKEPLRSPPPIPYSRVSGYSLRANSIDRMSLSPSPNSSISTVNTLSMKMPNHKNISIEVLKNEFVGYLINNCKGFNLATLLKLGELRLLDNLLVSFDGHNFAPKIVYLFENYLIEWNLNDTNLTLFPTKNMKINTMNPSILKLTSNHSKLSTIWLNSEVSLIIEKWVVATSDPSFFFPNDIITSTITFPNFIEKDEISPKNSILIPPKNSSTPFSFEDSDSTINLIPSALKTLIQDESPRQLLADDDNQVLSLNNNKIDLLFKHTNIEDINDSMLDDDSDEDSDQELIDNLMKSTEIASKMTTLNDLLNTIDNALIESKS